MNINRKRCIVKIGKFALKCIFNIGKMQTMTFRVFYLVNIRELLIDSETADRKRAQSSNEETVLSENQICKSNVKHSIVKKILFYLLYYL